MRSRVHSFVRAVVHVTQKEVGGLGWSFRQERAGESYAADELGKVFGFRFTNDAFRSKEDQLITLEVER